MFKRIPILIITLISVSSIAEDSKHYKIGDWSVLEQVDPLLDTTAVIITRISSTPEKAHISIACLRNETTFSVDLNPTYIGAGRKARVTIRMDKFPAEIVYWESYRGKTVLSNKPIPLIKKLMNRHTLMMRVGGSYTSTQPMSFDLSGLDEAIKPIREACNW